MKRTLVSSLAVCLGLIGCVSTPPQASKLDGELSILTSLLEGDYFSAADGGAREGRAIYMRIRNITPLDGTEHAMYAEMRHDGPNGEHYRQLVYVFDETPDRAENQMLGLRVADKSAAAKLLSDPDAYARGDVQTTSAIADDCYTVWIPDGDAFEGHLDPQRCLIIGKRGDERRIESRTRISNDAIGQLERGYTKDGTLLFGNPEGELYIWPRVSPQE